MFFRKQREASGLDEPAYPRSWNADRFFPHLPGRAELTRVLPADEARDRFARTSPSLDGGNRRSS
ncbi:hypothetical protein [Streptomyces geranii]|uniref:hypothetical protein n=1 Tax=Streptomyces geranii TaxID=2058923 RepID=UPI000D03CE00|nr:hypothetical protein [Streptomyces geranii]